MSQVISADGTSIAYDQSGKAGTEPAVILVDGALCYRAFGPAKPLSELLAPHLTVVTYDRRGRGESGDTQPYAVEREVEDIEALINQVGGSALLFGTSSGGCLALETATRLGGKVRKLAMYEPPYNSDPAARQAFRQYRRQLEDLLAAGRRGEAAALFMSYVGTPPEQIEGMRQAPVWSMFEAVAPTLAYDAAVMGEDARVPSERAAKVTMPTLVLNGSAIPFMRDTAIALAKTIPNGQQRTLEGQTHDVNLQVLAPVLVDFFLIGR